MTELSNTDKKLLDDIDQFGWHVVKVMGDEIGPGFAYSVGLNKNYNHPEIILVGLDLDLCHQIINDISEQIRNGETYLNQKEYGDIISNYNCYFLKMSSNNFDEYPAYAKWYYKEEVPYLQCVWPDSNGLYPFQENCSQGIKENQTLLGSYI